MNLTGLNIEDTYQRVLHTDGTTIFDGTGSVVVLNYTGSFVGDGSGLTNVTSTALPAGPFGSIQFNDGLVVSGSSDFTFIKSTSTLTLMGSMYATLFIGSLQGTASWSTNSVTASFVEGGTF